MTKKTLRYPTILFDWGDTVMRDDPTAVLPMVAWETVDVIEGTADVLAYLQSSGRRLVLATSAAISYENQIWGALARGGLDTYFSHIYCFKNTDLPKGEDFYSHILNDLGVSASDVLMVGDSFEKDVLSPNFLGIFAVWFNPGSDELQMSPLHITVHSMNELQAFFELMDKDP